MRTHGWKFQRLGLLGVALFSLALGIGCGGSGTTITSNVVGTNPRPPYGELELNISTAGVGTSHKLFLDYGTTQFPKHYPIQVGNDKANQAVTLWRYDFTEPGAASPAVEVYGTLLIRVDNGAAGFCSFGGKGGTWPIGAHILDPATAFPGNVAETPQNKVDTACFLFLRQGTPCVIVDPSVIGQIGGYRTLSPQATVAVSLPGLDFPVGGADLSSSGATPVVSAVGNDGQVTTMPETPTGQSQSVIRTPITTVDTQRVASTTLVSPVTSQWDLCFAWQPPSLGVTLTHSFSANPTIVGGLYATGEFQASGGGFFATMLAGAPDVSQGVNTLNWTYLRSAVDSAWVLGWSADLSATGMIQLGNGGDTFNILAPGQSWVTAQPRAFLSGTMDPSAVATIFQGEQDRQFAVGPTFLVEANKIPLISRSLTATMDGNLSQMLVGGRTLWYRQNSTILGADVQTSDQALTDKYGTTLSFRSYLPVSLN